MRARNIKPSFFKNEDLARLTYQARILFIGLWCLADREGRLEDRPDRIEVEVLPYAEKPNFAPCQHCASTIPALCQTLEEKGFIKRYEIDGNHYIQIINFSKHQYPHVRETESTIPAPKKHQTGTKVARLNPESPILNPESLNTAAPNNGSAELFDRLWQAYPKRLGKKQAFKHFNASVKNGQDVADIKKALQNYLQATKGKELEFIQHGSTWFNNWGDWVHYSGGKNASDGSESFALQLARRRAEIEAQKIRETASSGSLSSGVGNMSDVQFKHESSS